MTREEFIDSLQKIIDLDVDCKALVYFALKKNGATSLKKANIQEAVLVDIADDYKESLRGEIEKFNADAERTVLNISDRDDRANVVYRYDIPDVEPSFFDKMRDVAEDHPVNYFTGERMFNFDVDSLSDIDYFIIELGSEDNKVVIYRNNFNINLMKQAPGRFYFNKSGTQLTSVTDDILRMDTQIDVLKIGRDFLVLNLGYLDSSKEFAKIIKSRAEDSINSIEQLNLVDSVDGLKDRLSELAFARRLMKVMDSSPIVDMPVADVLDFVRNHEKLNKVLKVENDRIKFHTKKAQDYFIKLMNDDILHSKLTIIDYESSSKKKIAD